MNTIVVVGRLGRDGEYKFSPSGMPMLTFSLADGDGENTIWYDCTVFGKQADALKSLAKGQQVMVVGRFSLREWQTKAGEKRQSPTIIAQNVTALSGGRKKDANPSASAEDAETLF